MRESPDTPEGLTGENVDARHDEENQRAHRSSVGRRRFAEQKEHGGDVVRFQDPAYAEP